MFPHPRAWLALAALASAPCIPIAPAGVPPCPAGVQTLQRPHSLANERLGESISLDVDTGLLAAAAPGLRLDGSARGTALLYRRQPSGMWAFEAMLTIPAPPGGFSEFATSVACTGTVVAAGNPSDQSAAGDFKGAVYLFRRSTAGAWSPEQRLENPGPDENALFGRTIALVTDRLVAGPSTIPGDGLPRAMAHFVRSGATWSLSEMLTPQASPNPATNDYGAAAAMWGSRLAVGAPYERHDAVSSRTGAVFIHELNTQGRFVQAARVLNPSTTDNPFHNDGFGRVLALDGDRLLVAAPDLTVGGVITGAVYIYERTGTGDWSLVRTVHPPAPAPGDRFGASLALRGQWAVIGAPGTRVRSLFMGITGAAHVLQRSGPAATPWLDRGTRTYQLPSPFPDSETAISAAVAIDSLSAPSLILGAPETLGGLDSAGAVHILPLTESIVDCDANGLVDACEIAIQPLADRNSNGIPDRCCPADIDGNTLVTVEDVFQYLTLYFARSPRADTNFIGGVTVQDLFEFLASYFAGCS
jgi:hypothetical protein